MPTLGNTPMMGYNPMVGYNPGIVASPQMQQIQPGLINSQLMPSQNVNAPTQQQPGSLQQPSSSALSDALRNQSSNSNNALAQGMAAWAANRGPSDGSASSLMGLGGNGDIFGGLGPYAGYASTSGASPFAMPGATPSLFTMP